MEASNSNDPALQGVVVWVEEMMDQLMKPEEITDYFKTMVGSMIRYILEPQEFTKIDQSNSEIIRSQYFKTAAYYKRKPTAPRHSCHLPVAPAKTKIPPQSSGAGNARPGSDSQKYCNMKH